MNNVAVLSSLYEVAHELRGTDKEVFDACREAGAFSSAAASMVYGYQSGIAGLKLFELIDRMEKELKEKQYSTGGKTKELSALKRIAKNAEKQSRRGLAGVIETGESYVLTDGFRMVSLKEDVPLDRASVDPNMGKNLIEILEGTKNNASEKNIAEACNGVRAHIVEEKAKRKGDNRKRGERIFYDIPGTEIHVNAEFLVDMLDALPGCEVYPASRNEKMNGIYFKAENGEGILLPVNH